MDKILANEPGAEYDHTFITAAIESFEAYKNSGMSKRGRQNFVSIR